MRVIFFLIIINFLSDLYGLYTDTHNQKNYISYNLYILIETFSLYIFFYQIILSGAVKKTILLTIISFFIFWLYQFIRFGQQRFLDECITVENISLLAFCLYYYIEKIIKIDTAYIYTEKSFWIVTAYLIFISGTFFLLLYIPGLKGQEWQKYYVLNYVFVIIRTILLSIAMFMKNNDSPKQKFN